MPDLDDLFAVLYGDRVESEPTRATSLRIPERVHRAAMIATELGMDESLTAATTEALLDRIGSFARQQALAAHFERFPADIPPLADVASRRVQGTVHVAATRPELVEEVADWYEEAHPDWATSGRVDEAVDRVLEHVELLAARSGRGRTRA